MCIISGISTSHNHHSRCLSDFVEAQAAYYANCHQYMQELQRQLGRLALIKPLLNVSQLKGLL